MLTASIGGKYAAAFLTKKTFRFTNDEGSLIFGMSAASAAATLASVMVGYNIILSENEAGEPVRLLNEHVLNGSILLILISCTISSFVSMASAQRIADADKEETAAGAGDEEEKILLAVNHEHTVEKMVNLGLLIKGRNNKDKLFALNVINEDKSESYSKNAEILVGAAVNIASSADVKLNPITRHDNDVIAGINNVVKEQNITDLIIGLEEEKGFSSSFIYNLYNGYLQNKNINLIIYHAVQPVSTIKKYAVLIPADAELEPGFFHCLLRIWNIGKNTGAKMSFYANQKTIGVLKSIIVKANIEAVFNPVTSWQEAENTAGSLEEDEGLIILMADRGMHSYFPQMKEVPEILNKKLSSNNYILIYPFTKIDNTVIEKRAVSNLDDFADIGKIIGRIFK
jgi:hypothetical protein